MQVRLSDRPTPQNYGLLTCNIMQYSFNGINDKYVLLIEVHRLWTSSIPLSPLVTDFYTSECTETLWRPALPEPPGELTALPKPIAGFEWWGPEEGQRSGEGEGRGGKGRKWVKEWGREMDTPIFWDATASLPGSKMFEHNILISVKGGSVQFRL